MTLTRRHLWVAVVAFLWLCAIGLGFATFALRYR